MTPRSTVRLQLNPDFTLEQAVEHLPYYADLGISHLYLSPITCARKESTHGYDVIDHRQVDPRLGGEDALEVLAHSARERGMGLILDIVPNHMAAHPDNPWWYSVLKQGPASPFADWFDIQWDRPGLHNKLLLPILGDTYDVALEQHDIRLVHDGAEYGLEVHGLRLPLAGDTPLLDDDKHDVRACLKAHDPSTRQGRQALHDLLEHQHYRLAWWQCAPDLINWRRFFEISDLVGLCVERDDVFDAVHELPLRLFEQGWVDGLRIDHVDGLAYPISYCKRLEQAMQARISRRPAHRHDDRPWLIVEKILAHGEYLDTRWTVDGTSGYDFMDAVSSVMHDPGSAEALHDYWGRLVHDGRPVAEWRRDARALMVERHFPSEREALLDKFVLLAETGLLSRDASRHSLGRALDRLLIEFPLYRTYVTLTQKSEGDVHYLTQARDRAYRCLLDQRDLAALQVLDFIVDVLKGRATSRRSSTHESPAQLPERQALHADAIRRFQQLTPPLAAKALEDTVFYRYGRLLSRNEVGSDPGVFSTSVNAFHQWNQRRAQREPRAMNATATHDHKRGEDVRARLAVISELPQDWGDLSTRCLEALGQDVTIDCGAPAGHCYMLLQTAVGAWPPDLNGQDDVGMAVFIERLQQWQLKALREAKQKTSWFYPDEAYEQEQADRVEFMLCDPESLTCRSIERFVDRIALAGIVNSLAAVVLRCTAPGVPDLYQGTDLWDFSLVDPDNRRPVDLPRRAGLLHTLHNAGRTPPDLLPDWRNGAVKQAILNRCLQLRMHYPGLFLTGAYTPLTVDGPLANHLIAFSRNHDGVDLIVVVSRLAYSAVQRSGQSLALPLIPPDLWRDTRVVLPVVFQDRNWHDVLSGDRYHAITGNMEAGALLARLPVAVLLSS